MSSSEQETIYRFNSADLPLVSIPFDKTTPYSLFSI